MSLDLVAECEVWLSIAALLYTYIGYPLLIGILGHLRPRAVHAADLTPAVSIIITAYNEERHLRTKLENTLSLDYPNDRLEVIVASDHSTDRTDEIARDFARRGVRLLRQPERLGKTAAQNFAVQQARGDIILFSDATTLYRHNVVRAIMRNFADPEVGCVTGRLTYLDPSRSSVGLGARFYWGYESFLKRNESRLGSLVGASGCLYAVRRSAYVPFYNEAHGDFLIAVNMAEQGLRTVYEPDALCTEETNKCSDKELRMRVRVITQTLTDLWHHRAMMNPLGNGFFAVQLLSHKLLRYLAPVFLIVSLGASLLLAQRSLFYATILFAQLYVYLMAALAWVLERIGVRPSLPIALAQYFVLVNLASLIALYKFLCGEKISTWDTNRGPAAGGG